MKRRIFHSLAQASLASALLAVALPAIAPAQTTAPAWIRFTSATVKPEMTDEFEGYLKQLSAAYKKAGQPAFVVLNNFSGNRLEYTVVTFVMKFGDMDAPNPVQKSMGDEAYANLSRAMGRCVTDHTTTYSLPWDDVAIDKPGTTGEYMIRARVPIAAGKNADYRAYLKNDLKPAYEKGGVTWFRVSTPVFGGPPGVVDTVRMLKNLGEIDGGPALTRFLGADAARAMNAKAQALTRGPSQNTILRVRRELSLIPPSPNAR